MRNRTLNVYAHGPMLSLLEISAVVKRFIPREYSGTQTLRIRYLAGHVFSNLLDEVSIKIKGSHKVARAYVCYIPFTITRIKFVTNRENYYVLISR